VRYVHVTGKLSIVVVVLQPWRSSVGIVVPSACAGAWCQKV